jgi:hypothetical protein
MFSSKGITLMTLVSFYLLIYNNIHDISRRGGDALRVSVVNRIKAFRDAGIPDKTIYKTKPAIYG